MLSGTSFGKESGEGVIPTHELVGGHMAVGLDAVLEAVELPAGITDLATGLTDMDGDTFTL